MLLHYSDANCIIELNLFKSSRQSVEGLIKLELSHARS